jgi:hypothetical protein
MQNNEPTLGISSYLGEGGLLEISAALVRKFGGVNGLVDKWYDVFTDEDASPNVKRQIVINATEIIAKATSLKDPNETKKMSTEELREFALRLMGDHGGKLPWPDKKTPDGTATGLQGPTQG